MPLLHLLPPLIFRNSRSEFSRKRAALSIAYYYVVLECRNFDAPGLSDTDVYPKSKPIPPAEEWYYELDGHTHGPLSRADFEDLLNRSGAKRPPRFAFARDRMAPGVRFERRLSRRHERRDRRGGHQSGSCPRGRQFPRGSRSICPAFCAFIGRLVPRWGVGFCTMRCSSCFGRSPSLANAVMLRAIEA